jgi:hypothetical protein
MNVTEEDMTKIAEEIHLVSTKLAQEIYLTRRATIIQTIQDETGVDLSAHIPTVRKGRPTKKH